MTSNRGCRGSRDGPMYNLGLARPGTRDSSSSGFTSRACCIAQIASSTVIPVLAGTLGELDGHPLMVVPNHPASNPFPPRFRNGRFSAVVDPGRRRGRRRARDGRPRPSTETKRSGTFAVAFSVELVD